MNAISALRYESNLYQQLRDLPEAQVGEIINNQLYTQSRPSGFHGVAEGGIVTDILGAYQRGKGGPGGWWIIPEPEIHLMRDREVLVPDVAGWRKERMPRIPQGHRFEVVPDWVCEILSPATASKDRVLKLAVYARYGVPFCWLVDPLLKTLEVLVLDKEKWRLEGVFQDNDSVNAPPFDAVTLDLAWWWVEDA
ncbi:MAG: Uma2 family endonuclease [Magnetococcales bacterium]|nr:Uma2 family endonuclease [Magnetococcales bacterium]